jgi:hypothetical protein
MTMPRERVRSIGWGRETLGEIAHDNLIPAALRARASALHVNYPTVGQIESRIGDAVDVLPVQWWNTIGETLTLLLEVSRGGCGSSATQLSVLYTLRHYPDHGLIDFLKRIDTLVGWLEPDEDG